MAKTVLAAHPERHIRRLIEVNLERQGYRILMAADAGSVLSLAHQQSIDLIVLDGRMRDLQAALQADPATQSIPVQVLDPSKVPHNGFFQEG